jgi:hypothetical protein
MQETYLQDVFVCYNMSNCNLVLTPLEANKNNLKMIPPKIKKTSNK